MIHQESAFGDAIVASMVHNGWQLGSNADYRPDLGLDTAQLFTFIGATQAAEWEDLVTYYGGDRDAAQLGFAKRLDQAIAADGLLDVLRKGVKDHGVRIRVAYFRPSFVESEDILADYRANRLTVVRELAYATKQADAGNRLDLALFLNGIPVATAELKNPLTGQGVEHAKEQYRDPARPQRADLHPSGGGQLRRRPRPGVRHHPTARPEDPLPAVQHRAAPAPGGPAVKATRPPRSPATTPPHTCGTRSGSRTTGSTCWNGSCTNARKRSRRGVPERS